MRHSAAAPDLRHPRRRPPARALAPLLPCYSTPTVPSSSSTASPSLSLSTAPPILSSSSARSVCAAPASQRVHEARDADDGVDRVRRDPRIPSSSSSPTTRAREAPIPSESCPRYPWLASRSSSASSNGVGDRAHPPPNPRDQHPRCTGRQRRGRRGRQWRGRRRRRG
ncbi:hypothetical protein PVAP13_9KG023100 [Panicum virgatum]|uniref:Uncharacterized protein n=1 Tax=Panicum virgatum TaxID=38727 RepID=A0A8T0N3H5_PANVG|nr:hypothetical protein PVAP13_9KG023100 [Panicum virgatum]